MFVGGAGQAKEGCSYRLATVWRADQYSNETRCIAENFQKLCLFSEPVVESRVLWWGDVGSVTALMELHYAESGSGARECAKMRSYAAQIVETSCCKDNVAGSENLLYILKIES